MCSIKITATGMMEGLMPLALDEGNILIEVEIGTGKTALLARIFARVNKDGLDVVLCYDPRREKTAYEEFIRDRRVRVYKRRLWNDGEYHNCRIPSSGERETLVLVDAWSPESAAAAHLAEARSTATEHVVLTSSWPVDETPWSTVIQCRRSSSRYMMEMKRWGGRRDVSADVTVPDFQYGR